MTVTVNAATKTKDAPLGIKSLKVSDLVPYKNNPRKNDDAVPNMVTLIEKFGFKVPILVRGNDIVDGHLRVKAAMAMGLTEVPAIDMGDMTDAEEKALRIVINQSVSWAKWDNSKLDKEFKAIKLAGLDLALTGFDNMAITRIAKGAMTDKEVKKIAGSLTKTKDADAGNPADPGHVSLTFHMNAANRDVVMQHLREVQLAEGLGNISQALIHIASTAQK